MSARNAINGPSLPSSQTTPLPMRMTSGDSPQDRSSPVITEVVRFSA